MPEPDVRSLLIELEHGDEVCILHLKGYLPTGENADSIKNTTDEIRSHCNNLIADVREFVSIGSMGIGFLVSLYVSVTKKSGGGGFFLAGANQRVRDVLDITHLSTIIPSAPNLASARAALSGKARSS